MVIKFELIKEHVSQGIVTVHLDDDNSIQSISCTDPEFEPGLSLENPNGFKKFVNCTVSGTLCSDQIDLIYKRRWSSYKIKQVA